MATQSEKTRGYVGDPGPDWVLPVTSLQIRKIAGTPPYLERRQIPGPDVVYGGIYTSNAQHLNGVVGNRGGFNYCSHTKSTPIVVDWNPKGGERITDMDQIAGEWRTNGFEFGKLSGSIDPLAWRQSRTYPALPTPDWSQLVQSVGETLDGSMVASSNMLVTIAEAGQTYRMLRNPMNLLSARWGRSVRTLRQITKSGSNAFLEYKFGWRQLYRDLRSLSQAFSKARAHAAYLQSRKGLWSNCRKTVQLESSDTFPSYEFGNGLSGVVLTLGGLHGKRKASFSVDILRGEAFQILSSARYAQQYLGTDKLIEALWDVVPFSFVVDWFIDVGRLVALNPYFLCNRHQLRRLGYSYKDTWSANLNCVVSLPVNYGDNIRDELDLPDQEVFTEYHRIPGFPDDTIYQSIFGSLSIRQISTGGALIAQRW